MYHAKIHLQQIQIKSIKKRLKLLTYDKEFSLESGNTCFLYTPCHQVLLLVILQDRNSSKFSGAVPIAETN